MARPKDEVLLERFAQGRELLLQLAKSRDVLPSDVMGHYNSDYLIRIRKDFCLRAKEMGLGCISIGKILNRDHTTVLYHLSPAMQARKTEARSRRPTVSI
jgi:chromosomal replication initiation ATPase DnaA